MKRVKDTRVPATSPADFLLDASIVGVTSAVELQESEGQQSFVNSDTLPTKYNGYDAAFNPVATLQKFGFKFHGLVPGDEMFTYVTLPPGWQKKPSGHSMWSHIVDDKGRERLSIFYKAAFYDRDAFYNFSRRFGTRLDYKKMDEGFAVAYVLDGETVIHTTEARKLPATKDSQYYRISDEAQGDALAWLNTKYPDYQKVEAYWNE
jgi:hypothetical protein